MSSVEL